MRVRVRVRDRVRDRDRVRVSVSVCDSGSVSGFDSGFDSGFYLGFDSGFSVEILFRVVCLEFLCRVCVFSPRLFLYIFSVMRSFYLNITLITMYDMLYCGRRI